MNGKASNDNALTSPELYGLGDTARTHIDEVTFTALWTEGRASLHIDLAAALELKVDRDGFRSSTLQML